MANKLWKTSHDSKVRELAYLLYWKALGFYHYKKGEFNKILEDIGGLNLYWGFFRKKRYYEDLYYEILGNLYTLLFQYKRAVIFLLKAYKLKPSNGRFLNLIYAVEMTYYNELEPYYDFTVIKRLLLKVNTKELNTFQKAFYNFEKGFYYLLIRNYSSAYKFFKEAYKQNIGYLTNGQANFFMGRALEGLGKLKDAYFYYKIALRQVKHSYFKKLVLYRLFIVSAKLGYYQEANNYLFGLATFGGIQINPFLQEALLKIPHLDRFLTYFYWNDKYPYIVSQILWLNFENYRGEEAFKYFLESFLRNGKVYSDFLLAWKLYYPHEVKDISIPSQQVLKLSFIQLKVLLKIYKANRDLFNFFFKDYGYLALAKYYFLQGNWKKVEKFLKLAKLNLPLKNFIEGVLEAYRGQPYLLEIFYPQFKGNLKIEALFWLGWGYLLHNRWDLVNLYWDAFLKSSRLKEKYSLERLFASYYLGLHLLKEGFSSQGGNYLKVALKELSKFKNFKGLKRFITLKLAEIYGLKTALELMQRYQIQDAKWKKFLIYTFQRGE